MNEKILNIIAENQNTMMKDSTNIKVNIARIKEHLKTLNGSVARNEKNINNHTEQLTSTRVSLAKISAAGGLSGGFVAGVILLIKSLL